MKLVPVTPVSDATDTQVTDIHPHCTPMNHQRTGRSVRYIFKSCFSRCVPLDPPVLFRQTGNSRSLAEPAAHAKKTELAGDTRLFQRAIQAIRPSNEPVASSTGRDQVRRLRLWHQRPYSDDRRREDHAGIPHSRNRSRTVHPLIGRHDRIGALAEVLTNDAEENEKNQIWKNPVGSR